MSEDERRLPAETMVDPTADASPADSDDLPPDAASRYQLAGEHARGALGRVVRARDRRLHREVAIKQLVARGDRADARFVREAMVTARLQHPSIVPVYDAGRAPDGEPFYAMKMVEGRTLEDAIAAAPTLDARLALLPNVIAIAEAIAYAHREGVIHRDLKPSNVLVGEFGETVVVDWGVAQDLRAPSDTAGAVVGTPAYMSPEQARGSSVDERTDVYALGAILYHVLAGAPPYRGSDSAAVLSSVLAAPPVPIARAAPGVPIDLATIVTKAMSRSLSDRYTTAQSLAIDLRRFQTGQLVGAHHYTRRTLLWRWLARHRAIVAVVSILTTILAATAFYSVRRILRERAATEARNNELILLQAASSLDKDPTASIEWLKTYPADAADWPRAASIAADAVSRGVALHVLDGPRVNVYQLAWSPDGKLIAAAGSDGTIHCWDALSGRRLGIARTSSPVNAVAFSPDGATIAGGDDTGAITLWNPRDSSRRMLKAKARIEWLDFSRAQSQLVSADDAGEVHVWNLADGTDRVVGVHHGSAGVARFSPDGTRIVSGGADGVGLWRTEGGGDIMRGHTDTVHDVTFSPDGRLIASGSMDMTIRIWDVATGAARVLSGHTGGIEAIAFSSDGKMLASGSEDHTARIWDVAAGTELRTLRGHSEAIDTTAFSPDGTHLVTAGFDGAISIWDVASGTRQTFLGHVGWVAARFSPKGDLIVSAGHDLDVRVWRGPRAPLRVLVGNEAGVFSVDACRDGRFISGGADRTVRVFDDSGAGRIVDRLEERVAQVLCTADARYAIALGFDGAVRMIDLAVPSARTLETRARAIALSHDGALLAVGVNEPVLRIYDTKTWQAKPIAIAKPIDAIAFAPDGRIAFTTSDGVLTELEVHSGKTTPIAIHVAAIVAPTYAPDSHRIAWVDRDNVVRIYESNHERGLGAPGGLVTSLAFSTDGARLAATSTERVARVWDLDDDRSWSLPHPDVARVSAFIDPNVLVTGCNDGSVIYWNLRDGSRLMFRGGSGYVVALASTIDRARVATGGTDPQIDVWTTPTDWMPERPDLWFSSVTSATLPLHPN